MIFSAITLLVTILGLGGTIVALMISGQKEILREHDMQLVEIQRNINIDKVEQTKANTHIDSIVTNLEKEHKATEDLVTDLKVWRLNHATQNGSNTARLEALEKSLDRIEKRQYDHEQDIFKPKGSQTSN